MEEGSAIKTAEDMFAADAASQGLGIKVDQVSPGHARARMTVAATMINGHGIAHGGYVFLLADTAFAVACNTYGEETVARQCEITFLRPTSAGDELVAVASERIRSGRSGIYDVSVTRPDGEIIAEMRGHSATLKPR